MTIALVGRRESTWLSAVAERCVRECVVLELESVLRGGALTVDGGRVHWDGFDLHTADAVLLERAVFAWPQPGSGRDGLSPQAEREARALLLSALRIAAETSPVLEHPRHAHLAVAPALALDQCARAGSKVHPWSLVAARPPGDDRIWLDPGGPELRYAPRAPEPGEPAFAPEPFTGELLTVLVIDGQAVGARRHADAAAWKADVHEALVCGPEVPLRAAQAAIQAQRALGLTWAEVALRDAESEHSIVHMVPDAELGRWDSELSGAASTALAALLESRIGTPR